MKVAIGADAYGYPMKLVAIRWLKAQGHEVADAGIHSMEPDARIMDYADAVAGAVSRGEADRGILMCMSGGFMCIRANRWPGVRAVMAMNGLVIKHDREASDSNVLCFAAHYMDANMLEHKLKTFMETPFEPLARRVARLARLDEPVE